jgi:hypothetical protein
MYQLNPILDKTNNRSGKLQDTFSGLLVFLRMQGQSNPFTAICFLVNPLLFPSTLAWPVPSIGLRFLSKA